MTLNELCYVQAVVNATVEDCRSREYTMKGAVSEILNILITELFWDYETDMPTVDYNQWDRFITNTVRKIW